MGRPAAALFITEDESKWIIARIDTYDGDIFQDASRYITALIIDAIARSRLHFDGCRGGEVTSSSSYSASRVL